MYPKNSFDPAAALYRPLLIGYQTDVDSNIAEQRLIWCGQQTIAKTETCAICYSEKY